MTITQASNLHSTKTTHQSFGNGVKATVALFTDTILCDRVSLRSTKPQKCEVTYILLFT